MKYLSVFLVLLFVLQSCKKDASISYTPLQEIPKTEYCKLKLKFTNDVNGSGLVYNNYSYYLCDSTNLEFTSLEYMLSDIKVFYTDGTNYKAKQIKTSILNEIVLDSMLYGSVAKIELTMGVKSNNVPADQINEASSMYWPASMGGGYHYFKLEGHYKDSNNVVRGFAIHTGGDNLNTSNIILNNNNVISKSEHTFTINFDPLKTLTTPNCYSFVLDPNYTMSSEPAMQKIMSNTTSAFSIVKFE